MKVISVLVLSLFLTFCASAFSKVNSALNLSSSVYHHVHFIRHEESLPMKSWLGMNISYPEIQSLKNDLEKKIQLELKSRDEAHITVLTPIEYDKVISKKITITEVHDLAERMKIQNTRFKSLCVGSGSKEIDGKTESTYYVVVKAENLLKIREMIHKVYIARGGNSKDFDPFNYYPHITIGFTKRDLHFEEGIIKDERSCIYKLRPVQ